MEEVQDAVGLVEGSAKRQYVQVPVIIPIHKQEIISNAAGADGSTMVTALNTTLKGRGVRVSADNTTFLPYYPLQVDVNGDPEGENVIVQPESS